MKKYGSSIYTSTCVYAHRLKRFITRNFSSQLNRILKTEPVQNRNRFLEFDIPKGTFLVLALPSFTERKSNDVVTLYGYKIVAVGGLSPDKIAVMGVSMFSTLIRGNLGPPKMGNLGVKSPDPPRQQ